VQQCASQFFGADFSPCRALRNVVRRAVMLHDMRMGDRNIRGSLFKLSHGIAARGHHLRDQCIGAFDGSSGVVDKSSLFPAPRLGKLSYLIG